MAAITGKITEFSSLVKIANAGDPTTYLFRNPAEPDPFGMSSNLKNFLSSINDSENGYESTVTPGVKYLEGYPKLFQERFEQVLDAEPDLLGDGYDDLRQMYSRKNLQTLFKNALNPELHGTLPHEFALYLHHCSSKDTFVDTRGIPHAWNVANELQSDTFFINQSSTELFDQRLYGYEDPSVAQIEKAYLIFSCAITVFKIFNEEFNHVRTDLQSTKLIFCTTTRGCGEYSLRVQNIIEIIVKVFARNQDFNMNVSNLKPIIACHECDSEYTAPFGHLFEVTLTPKSLSHSEPLEESKLMIEEAKKEFHALCNQKLTKNSLKQMEDILRPYPQILREKINYFSRSQNQEIQVDPINLALRRGLPALLQLFIKINPNILYDNDAKSNGETIHLRPRCPEDASVVDQLITQIFDQDSKLPPYLLSSYAQGVTPHLVIAAQQRYLDFVKGLEQKIGRTTIPF